MASTILDHPSGPRLTQGPRVVRWCQANLVHTNGEWIGKPFRFLPWQKRMIYELFEVDSAAGLRRYRWAYISIPKKNGKSETAAALALYLLIGDGEPAPLIPCAAASDEQADIVFGAAATMCKMSPTLSLITEVFDKEILVPSIPGAKLERVAAVAGTNDGKNAQAVICDELHEWQGPRGRAVWTVLTNATVNRRQPMVIQTTTAGWDLESICGQQYTYAKKVKSGEIDDPQYYSFIVEAPGKWPDGRDVDYRSPDTWKAANPSYGVLVTEDSLRNQLSKPEGDFRRYFLNQWTRTQDIWVPLGAWEACTSDLQLDPNLPLHVGIDLGLKHDSSAVVAAQKQTDREGKDRTVVRAKVWENPYLSTDKRHGDWKLNISEVEEYLRELFLKFPIPACEIDGAVKRGPEFCYDPAFFERSAQLLEKPGAGLEAVLTSLNGRRLEGVVTLKAAADPFSPGLAMVEFPQTDSRMIPASQNFYQLIVEGKIAHDGDPALKRHVENVTADPKPRGAYRMSKPKGSRKKIDAAIAAAIAALRAQEPAPAEAQSVYETRGPLSFSWS